MSAGDTLWQQLENHARMLSGFHWCPAGAEWVDPNLTNERRASISKAVTDLLKDILKKQHQQEKECEEEAKTTGINVINASIKLPLKKKSKSLPFNSFMESANRLITLGAIHIEASAAQTQIIAQISIFDPEYDLTFSSFGSDDNYI